MRFCPLLWRRCRWKWKKEISLINLNFHSARFLHLTFHLELPLIPSRLSWHTCVAMYMYVISVSPDHDDENWKFHKNCFARFRHSHFHFPSIAYNICRWKSNQFLHAPCILILWDVKSMGGKVFSTLFHTHAISPSASIKNFDCSVSNRKTFFHILENWKRRDKWSVKFARKKVLTIKMEWCETYTHSSWSEISQVEHRKKLIKISSDSAEHWEQRPRCCCMWASIRWRWNEGEREAMWNYLAADLSLSPY